MPIYRFSAIEQRGVLLPDPSYAAAGNTGRLVELLLSNNVLPTLVPGDMMEDVTPPYFSRNRFNYLVTTPPQPAVAEEATAHLMPRDISQKNFIVDMSTRTVRGEMRQIRLPQDSIIIPIASPEAAPPHLIRLHELFITSGATALRGMDIPVQPPQQ